MRAAEASGVTDRTGGATVRTVTYWRLSLFIATLCLALFAATDIASAANINATATGTSVQQPDGTVVMTGTWFDPTTGVTGTYRGSYTPQQPANFSSCQFFIQACPGPGNPAQCNIVTGSLTLSSPGAADINLTIPARALLSPHPASVVCEPTPGGPVHTVAFFLLPPYPEMLASLDGTSTTTAPGISADTFTIEVRPSHSDPTPPSCVLSGSGQTSDGRNFIEIATADPETGLYTIEVLNAENAQVVTQRYAPGLTIPVAVTATAVDPRFPADVSLRINDSVYNETLCDFTIPASLVKPPKPPKPAKPAKP